MSITISSSQIIPAHSFELVRMRKMRASCFADVSQCALSVLCVRKQFSEPCDVEFPKMRVNNKECVSEVIPRKIRFALRKLRVNSQFGIHRHSPVRIPF